MSWTKIMSQGAVVLAVSLAPALKASAPPAHRAGPPCAQVLGLNEGRHRRRMWQEARMTALEKPRASAASLGMP